MRVRRFPDRRLAASCSLVALLLVAPLGASLPAVAAPTPPACTVTLNSSSAVAHPTSSTSDTLTFEGSIHVSLGSLSGSRTVQITAEAFPDTWAAHIDPSSKEVTGSADIPINATVAVPAGERATTAGRLVVTATFQWVTGFDDPSTTCSSQANVQVAQYYGVNADALTPRVTVKTGPTGTTAEVLVDNLGNGHDVFRVELENAAELQTKGIITSLPFSATLTAGQNTTVTFSVNASSDTEEGAQELYIIVTSTNEPSVTRSTQVTAVVEQNIITKIFDPTAIILLAAVVAAVGGAAAFIRSRRRRRRARDAKRQLDKIRRLRREASTRAAEESDAGEASPARAPR